MPFTIASIPSLLGKVAIVTGANSGIGKETSLELARKGAHVYFLLPIHSFHIDPQLSRIMACRSKARSQPVADEIIQATGNTKVEILELDLNSLKSAVQFADAFRAKQLPLHILVANAGIMMPLRYTETEDGLESQFAVNYLSHFLLTMKLLPLLEKSAPSRIVLVSSGYYTDASKGIPLEHVNSKERYSARVSYGYSKLATILFAHKLASQMKDKKAQVFVNSLHPGVVNTGLTRQWGCFVNALMAPYKHFFFMTPQQGALTQLYLATHPEVETQPIQGEYYVPVARKGKLIPIAQDAAAENALWDYSIKLVRDKLGPNVLE